MSGAEAIAVLGLISSIIAIVDATKQIYDAAQNAKGLPSAFREVSDRLPIITNILSSANLDIRNKDEASCLGVKPVIEACETKAKTLKELFQEAIPAGSAGNLQRYWKVVKAYGHGNEVENLMKAILEDVQLLACEHGMKTVTKDQQNEIAQAITDVSAVAPSVPEHVFQDPTLSAINSGSGTQNIAQGEHIAQGQARQYISGGGPMNFGKD
jgi:N-terminal domain on NACHT_NTPase and P-loop NTPases